MGFSNCKYNTKKTAEELGISEDKLVEALNKFAFGGFARIWEVKNQGNYSTAKISISKKDKNTNTYDIEFMDGFVRLVGHAHNTMKNVVVGEKGVSVRITNCDVTNLYTSPEGKKSYTPHYTIFGLELQDKGNTNRTSEQPTDNGGSEGFMEIPEGAEEELPFV